MPASNTRDLDWLKGLSLAIAALSLGAAFMLYAPGKGWHPLLLLPLASARALTVVAALLLTSWAGLLHIGSLSRIANLAYDRLILIAAQPISVIASAVAAILGVFYLYVAPARGAYVDSFWLGQTFVGLMWLFVAMLLMRANLESTPAASIRWLVPAAILALAIGLALRLWLIFVWDIDLDEGFRLGATANVLRGGGITPIMSHFPSGTRLTPWRGYSFALYGAWARLSGLGVPQARILSYVMGVIALPIVYGIANLWYGKRAAWITSAVFALSVVFAQTSIARNDAIPTVLAAATLFTHVLACKSKVALLHTMTGILGVFALEGHVLNVIFLGAIGGTYLTDFLLGVRSREIQSGWHPLWYYVIGLIPASLAYLYLHILTLPDPSSYFYGISTGFPQRNFVLWRITVSLARVWTYWWHSPVENVLIVLSVIAALVRRTEPDKHWLTLLAWTQIGYFGAEINGSIHHTAYGLPIFLAATGAFVTYGFSREPRRGSAWERLAFAGIAIAMAANTAGVIRQHAESRRHMETDRAAALAYIRQTLPTHAAIISSPDFYPYLTDYETFLYPYHPVADKPAALAQQPTDAYWREVILRTWPEARLVPPDYPFEPLDVYATYVSARHMEPVRRHLAIPTDGPLVTDAPYATRSDAALQMVAHRALPDAIAPGSTSNLHTLWVTRANIGADFSARLAIVDDSQRTVVEYEEPLVSGWAEQTTSGWGSDQFHDVALALRLPDDLEPGNYELRLTLTGEESACAPGCSFVIDEIAISTHD